jgi:ABC-2 type transport system ATP-binding protein
MGPNSERTVILVEDLRKSYGPQVAVDGLELSIRKGETLGLLGPNGAGKTTTINMMVGLLKPDSGLVAIGDVDQTPGTREEAETDRWARLNPLRPEVRSSIGVAPQSLSLYDDLTAHENLSFFGGLYGLSGTKLADRVNWALDFASLADRKNHRVSTYSGGMKRRLNIAVALLHEPEILLLDEPTVGVDPQSRNHIFESIEALKQDGLTIIYTTHYMEEAQRLCDRVAIIDHGKLLDIGSVAELIARHGGLSVVTAQLQQPVTGIALPGQSDGLELRFETEDPIAEISRLTSAGVAFRTLQINQADLESVFLQLTGRSLRD